MVIVRPPASCSFALHYVVTLHISEKTGSREFWQLILQRTHTHPRDSSLFNSRAPCRVDIGLTLSTSYEKEIVRPIRTVQDKETNMVGDKRAL